MKDDLGILELCLRLELNNTRVRAAFFPHEPVGLINNPLHNVRLVAAFITASAFPVRINAVTPSIAGPPIPSLSLG
jgi:hypothetical protein